MSDLRRALRTQNPARNILRRVRSRLCSYLWNMDRDFDWRYAVTTAVVAVDLCLSRAVTGLPLREGKRDDDRGNAGVAGADRG